MTGESPRNDHVPMAAQVCTRCDIAYPPATDHKECGVCGAGTEYQVLRDADGDWQERVDVAQGRLGPDAERIADWRRIRLGAWGFAGLFLELLVQAPQIPLAEIGRLIARGCSPELAARIVL